MRIFVLLFLSLLWNPYVYAGGGYDPEEYIEDVINIIPKQLFNTTFHRPYQFATMYRDQSWVESYNTKKLNLAEWSNFLGVDQEKAERYVYQAKNINLLASDTQEYIRFVHKYQSLVSPYYSWDVSEDPKADLQKYTAQCLSAIKEAEQKINKARTPFLKQRWLFVMMRLAHYSYQFDMENQLYMKYAPALKKQQAITDNEVWGWINALLAGRLKQIARTPKERAQAAYQFALVFDQSKSKRIEAYHNFSIQTDEEWKILMSICKNDSERALIHFIRALTPGANTFAEVKSILQLDPNSKWAKELLVWELEAVQHDFIYSYAEPTSPPSKAQLQIKKDLADLRALFENIIRNKQQKDLFLAHFAQLYIRVLQEEKVGHDEFKQFAQTYQKHPGIKYAHGLELLVYVSDLETINGQIEQQIGGLLQRAAAVDELVKSHLKMYIYKKLATLYDPATDPAKSLICRKIGNLNAEDLTTEQLDIYLAFLQKPNRNLLEKEMEEYNLNQDGVHLYKSMRFIEQQDYQSAFQSISMVATDSDEFRFDPFVSSLGGNNRNTALRKSTKRIDFVKRMLQLSERVKTNQTDAEAYFLLGNGHYNTTWFGNAPLLIRTYRSTYSWEGGAIDFKAAKRYYQKALQHVTTDELKAQILYALAKIEFAETEIEITKKDPEEFYFAQSSVKILKRHGFGSYFSQLYDLQHTKYHKEVIRQCPLYVNARW